MVVQEAATVKAEQVPLLHVVDEDELILRADPDADWYRLLVDFPWWEYRELAALYYEALARFNEEAETRREERREEAGEPVSKWKAGLAFCFERPTMGNESAPLLYESPVGPEESRIDPETLAPGVVPIRNAGRRPKCFFGLFKAFVGVSLMGRASEPEEVRHTLSSNPAFARVCGFTPKKHNKQYRGSAVPSLRKLEQFDQIMTESGLWEQAQWTEVARNLETGTIHPERTLVHDTTHYPAYSSFETVVWIDENGKEQRKSQSKMTKSCTCPDKKDCAHEWELCDDGAGTVVKSSGRMYWAHKASVLALPEQGVPLDAVAMTDAASHDSKSVLAHLERLDTHQREFLKAAEFLLDDSAADDADLRTQVFDDFELTLRTPINPRSRKPQTEDLPRGMARLTPYGELVCEADLALDYLGVRWEDNVFLYGPPKEDDGLIACLTCPQKETCCPRAKHGRRVTLPFDALPHIDANDPPMAKRFRAMMTRRPAVERVLKRLKHDFSEPQLTKRGNASFQARLNKTMIAFHLLLRA